MSNTYHVLVSIHQGGASVRTGHKYTSIDLDLSDSEKAEILTNALYQAFDDLERARRKHDASTRSITTNVTV